MSLGEIMKKLDKLLNWVTTKNKSNWKITIVAQFVIIINVIFCMIETAEASDAILFGASDYEVSPLSNPVNDVEYLSSKLSALGWNVTVVKNPTSQNIKRALKSFAGYLENEKTSAALVYFSGHGFQFSGENYLVPTDISESSNLIDRSLSISEINYFLRKVNAPKILIIDACRSAAFGEGTIAVSTGLNSQNAPPNTLIAYATAPGMVAYDGPSDGYSPYAHSLGTAISSSVDIMDVFQKTRIGTMELTDGEQIPWESSSLIQNVSFTPSSISAVETSEIETALSATPYIPDADFVKVEEKKNHIKDKLTAIEYLITLAENSSNNAFMISYPRISLSASPDLDRKDIIETLNWQKNREIDRYSLYSIVTSLQNGIIHPSCNENGILNHNCSNSDKQFLFTPHLEGALKLANYANETNINSSLLARHYEKGWLVEKNLVKAYDLYMKDKHQDGEYYWSDVNRMIQNELVNLGENIAVDGDFGSKSCSALKKYIGKTQCTNPINRAQVQEFSTKVLRAIN